MSKADIQIYLYTPQVVMATLYRKQLSDYEVVVFSSWEAFIRNIHEVTSQFKVIIVEYIKNLPLEDLQLLFIDKDTYFIFLTDREEIKFSFPPLNYFALPKSTAVEDISDLIDEIVREGKILSSTNFNFSSYFKWLGDFLEKHPESETSVLTKLYLLLDKTVDKYKIKTILEGKKFSKDTFLEKYYTQEKQFICPVCGNKFTEKIVNYKKLTRANKYDDYFVEYKEIEPFLRQFITCPSCYFTFMEKDYPLKLYFLIVDQLKQDTAYRREIFEDIELKEGEKKLLLWELSYKKLRPKVFELVILLYKYWYYAHVSYDHSKSVLMMKGFLDKYSKLVKEKVDKERLSQYLPQINWKYLVYKFKATLGKVNETEREEVLKYIESEGYQEEVEWLGKDKSKLDVEKLDEKSERKDSELKVSNKNELIELL